MAEDYYQLLGIERTASQDDIKRAYRKMAHKHHPDKDGGDEEHFKKINEAYQTLGDADKRSQYDQFGQTFDQGNPFAGGGFGGARVDFNDLGGFADIFSDFFGGGRGSGRGAQVRRGDDVTIDLTLDIVDTVKNNRREIKHRIYQACSRCHGNRAEPGTAIKKCPTCDGKGRVMRTQQTVFGVFQQAAVCSDCHGEGKKPEVLCTECRGEGRQRLPRTLDVDIPAGIADGQVLRVTGKGEIPAGGGMAGDLFVRIHVTPRKNLVRDDDDVRSTIPISFVDAALGTTIDLPGLYGEENVTIPSGTQPGAQMRLLRKGFPQLQGNRTGDHIITVEVEIPRKLSRQQKELLEEFKKAKKKFLF